MSLRVCTPLHDLLALTKHCVGARISSFGLVARVPTSGENSLRTLLGEGLALATRSTRARKQPKRANLALEIANLAPRTADKAAKTANLAAKTAQLGVPRPFQMHLGAAPSRSRAPKPPKIKISWIFHRFFINFFRIFAPCARPSDCAKRFFFFCSAASVRLTTCRRKTQGYRFRLAFGCSSLPARVPRSNPQVASQRFTRCSKVSAPSIQYTYTGGLRPQV